MGGQPSRNETPKQQVAAFNCPFCATQLHINGAVSPSGVKVTCTECGRIISVKVK